MYNIGFSVYEKKNSLVRQFFYNRISPLSSLCLYLVARARDGHIGYEN